MTTTIAARTLQRVISRGRVLPRLFKFTLTVPFGVSENIRDDTCDPRYCSQQNTIHEIIRAKPFARTQCLLDADSMRRHRSVLLTLRRWNCQDGVFGHVIRDVPNIDGTTNGPVAFRCTLSRDRI